MNFCDLTYALDKCISNFLQVNSTKRDSLFEQNSELNSNSLVYSTLNSLVQDVEEPISQNNEFITVDKSKESVRRGRPRLSSTMLLVSSK